MQIIKINIDNDIPEIKKVIALAFSETSDSNINDWFSIEEMISTIKTNRGVCYKTINDTGGVIGIIHAMQENPINGKEGTEKWVITNLAVLPKETGKGIGGKLLAVIENEVRKINVKKVFVHTNLDDNRVINFYEKNGYKKVGKIDSYYYDGSAIFLLKHIS